MVFSRLIPCCVLVSGLFLSGAIFFAHAEEPGNATVHVVFSSNSSSYERVKDGFVRGVQDGSAAKIRYYTLSDMASLSQSLAVRDLVITVGVNAAEVVLGSDLAAAGILCVFIPKTAFESLVRADPAKRISAIYLDQPFERQLSLGRHLLPQATTVGVAFGAVSSARQSEVAQAARQLNLELQSVHIGPGNFVKQIRPLLKSSDVFLAIPDPQVNSPRQAKWLLYSAYRQKVPVLGFSKAYVTAGALAAVFSTPEQIGKHSAELAQAFLIGESWSESVFPKYYSVEVNHSVARSLGIKIPVGIDEPGVNSYE
ncbi:MAG: hypothetical protein OEZ68_14330 [Gammaproteobacteria bacterium]|nr:hypothetical protein [Gammaproteobacteria bacterium]MDH5801981.1 hypothetical protein [Gammaproteobacteria bacterium]